MTLSMKEIRAEVLESGGKTPLLRVKELGERFPESIALRNKEFGIWNEISYLDFWSRCTYLASALMVYGVNKGEKVAVHSENRPEWFISDLGIQAAGAVTVGLYPTNPKSEVEYLLGHSETVILFAEDQEQVDKALAVQENLPSLKLIVYFDKKGMYKYDSENLISFDEFLEIGKEKLELNIEQINQTINNIKDDDLALLVYTSGTTGPPKGSMITHGNLKWVSGNLVTTVFVESVKTKNPQFLSYLPLCHIFARLTDLLIATQLIATINFSESTDTVQSDLVDIQPDFFPAVPRIWERMYSTSLVRMRDASFFKKLLFEFSLKLGYLATERRINNSFDDVLAKVLLFIANILSFRSLKKKLGLSKIAFAISGAAPIGPEVLKFFMALGVPIFEAYGMTENCAYVTSNDFESIELGSVGRPHENCEIKISDDGEILTRHGGVFKGYFKDEQSTREVIDEEGWLHTGDVGEFTEKGSLIITDRKKDIIMTSGGKNVSPSEIENKIKSSPYIKDALVVGDKRKFLSCLIAIEFDTVSNWALRKKIPFTTYRDLTEKPEVRELVSKDIVRANEETSSLQVRKFELIPKELDHEDGELTATQKIKRSVIIEQFSELVESMYK
ncbi:MAG: long-chain fatty acid--CoA ligase [Candidatus Neomarinimicrobiota bacterium]